MLNWIFITILILIVLRLLNNFEYKYLNNKILVSQKWDLNICSGKKDGGGINADVKKYIDLPNFVLIEDIYHLPFKDKEFKDVLCAHTLEHVDDPNAFYKELRRVGEKVTVVLPPIWDLGATFNVFEHKWIFLTLKTKHLSLPPKVHLPLSNFVHKHFGQVFHA